MASVRDAEVTILRAKLAWEDMARREAAGEQPPTGQTWDRLQEQAHLVAEQSREYLRTVGQSDVADISDTMNAAQWQGYVQTGQIAAAGAVISGAAAPGPGLPGVSASAAALPGYAWPTVLDGTSRETGSTIAVVGEATGFLGSVAGVVTGAGRTLADVWATAKKYAQPLLILAGLALAARMLKFNVKVGGGKR